MARETHEDREFSENIDRLLAGQEFEAGEDMPEDYRTAMQFAQKLKGLGDKPSPAFRGELRRRLLAKLAEPVAEKQRKERASFWEFLSRFVPRSPVWRSATATVFVAVVAIVVLWGTGILTQAPEQWAEKGPAPAMAPTPAVTPKEAPAGTLDSADVLTLEPVLPETNAYSWGEEVRIDLIFRNSGPEPITFAPFPPAIHISRADTDATVRSFAPGSEGTEIPASTALSYTLVWDQLDNSGWQVEPGRYFIVVSDVAIQKGAGPRETRASFAPVTELIIQSP